MYLQSRYVSGMPTKTPRSVDMGIGAIRQQQTRYPQEQPALFSIPRSSSKEGFPPAYIDRTEEDTTEEPASTPNQPLRRSWLTTYSPASNGTVNVFVALSPLPYNCCAHGTRHMLTNLNNGPRTRLPGGLRAWLRARFYARLRARFCARLRAWLWVER